ncbi:metalloprotease [Phragmitibacter flavus]|uniref:metalloprotease n=1 Tax=Phragmitibacter flavus TaxID=2576071 RepID=UPI001407CA64|nr:site-2 protease family protein [Phragmitibacter flavus]
MTCGLIGGGLGATTRDQIIALAMFIAAAFVSILIHELGHAFLMRKYGARASIMLYAMGGLAAPDRWFSRGQSIVVSLAGPLVQIAIGVLVLMLVRNLQVESLFLRVFVSEFIQVSVFWALLNLVPIYPLDGGQVLNSALGPGQTKITFTVSVVAAVLMSCFFLVLFGTNGIIGVLMFGMLAFENVQRLRGERPNSMLNPQQ